MRGAREHNLKDITVALPRDRLVVITGLSGSGKSSLAFDTIYAEGQRRYVESLSAYARQFLGQMEKPDVDQIDGLSPAISIDQKGSSRNPRSTVGTVTEIYDYLRLLFARVGHPHCPVCGREIERQTVQQIVEHIQALPDGTRLLVLGPLVKDRKTEGERVFEAARRQGFVRVRVDGELRDLDDVPTLDKYKRHTIEVVVDRLVVHHADDEGRPYDRRPPQPRRCPPGRLGRDGPPARRRASWSSPRPTPTRSRSCATASTTPAPTTAPRSRTWSRAASASTRRTAPARPAPGWASAWRSTRSWSCPTGPCRSPRAPCMRPFARMPMADSWYGKVTEAVARAHGWDPTCRSDKLPPEALEHLLWAPRGRAGRGSATTTSAATAATPPRFEGLIPNLERRYKETDSEYVKSELERFMVERPCPTCGGKRLKPEALAVTVTDLRHLGRRGARRERGDGLGGRPARAPHGARADDRPAGAQGDHARAWASWSTSAWTT